jgi:hypothetical protein
MTRSRLRCSARTCLWIAALWTRAAAAQEPATIRARIEGVVWDSLGTRALPDAQVRIVNADSPSDGWSVTSDARGRFSVDSVPAGSWLASFSHPLLDSLRIEPAVVQIDIRRPGSVRADLAVPSASTLIGASCGPQLAQNTTRALVYGTIRSARNEEVLDSTSIVVAWLEDRVQKDKFVREPVSFAFPADAEGRFSVCDVPRGRRIRLMASRGADASGDIEIDVPTTGIVRRDLLIGVGANSRDSIRTRARATVRGRLFGNDSLVPRGAQLVFRLTGEEFRADSGGRFQFALAPVGTQTLEIRAIGYAPYRLAIDLHEGDAQEFNLTLPVISQQLDRVLVRASRVQTAEVNAIQARINSRTGYAIDADMIRERGRPMLSDALRGLNGVRLTRTTGFNQSVLMRAPSGGECEATLWVDGMRVRQSSGTRRTAMGDVSVDDLVTHADVALIEVFPRNTSIPVQYLDADGCGVVAIWTRRTFTGDLPKVRNRQRPAADSVTKDSMPAPSDSATADSTRGRRPPGEEIDGEMRERPNARDERRFIHHEQRRVVPGHRPPVLARRRDTEAHEQSRGFLGES